MLGLAVTLIAGQLFSFSIWSALWPLTVVIPGAVMLGIARSGNPHGDEVWLTIPAMLTLGTGLILAYQNTFDHWISWTYIWVLYGVFLGWSFIQVDNLLPDDEAADLVPIGEAMIRYSLIALAGGVVLVELLIIGGWERQIALAIILIAAGIYMLNRDDESDDAFWDNAKPKRKNDDRATPDDAMVYGLGPVHIDVEVKDTPPHDSTRV